MSTRHGITGRLIPGLLLGLILTPGLRWPASGWGPGAAGVVRGQSDRPILRTIRTDRFAGRVLVVPGSAGLESRREMKMLADLADHELLIPPVATNQSPALLREWIRQRVGLETDGLIINPPPAGAGSALSADWQNLVAETVAQVGQRCPWLLIEAGPSSLSGQVSGEVEASVRLTRLVNRRFGETPRILPFYSESGNEPLRRTVSLLITAVGGVELSPAGSGTIPGGPPDLLLFVALPGTSEAGHQRMAEGLRKTIGRGVRVAIADLTTDRESKGRLSDLLRGERWLDRLASLAASEPAAAGGPPEARAEAHGTTIARSLTHAVLFLTGLRSLRDDLDRVYRLDRTQVALLLGRYLRDYTYPLHLDGKLNLNSPSTREEDVLARLRPLADEIFKEQFRRNVHATRLATGERVRYEVSLLQQLRVRMPEPGLGRGSPEIFAAIHLAWLGNQSEAKTAWAVTNETLPPRLIKRWLATPWSRLETGAERVRVTFNFKRVSPAAPPASYRIVSRLSGTIREIQITGLTEEAVSFAISHLRQLGATGELVRDLERVEWPRTKVRGIVDAQGEAWSLRERLDLLTMLGQLRLNRYVLIQSEGDSTFSTAILAELHRAADAAGVELQIASEPPPGSRPLYPAGSSICFAPLRDLAETGAADGDDPLLFRLNGSPYLAWPRLASAATLAWNPRGDQPAQVAAILFPGLDPAASSAYEKVLATTPDCRANPTGHAATALDQLPVTGHQKLSLFRGALRQHLKEATPRGRDF